MAIISVSDNFCSEYGCWNVEGNRLHCEYYIKEDAKLSNSLNRFFSSSKANIGMHIDGRYFNLLPGNIVLSFKSEDIRIHDDELILSIQQCHSSNGNIGWRVKSGNYVGNLQFQKHRVELRSRFSDAFLQRMMAVVSGVYLSEAQGKDKTPTNYAEFILHYLFVQKLERAFLLGFPTAYSSQKHHASSLRGRVDISRLMRKDMPFKGNISSTRRERKVDEEIVSTLYYALKIINRRNKAVAMNISSIYEALLQFKPMPLKKDSVEKAKLSKALNNPIFSPYRDLLELAELIIKNESLNTSLDNENSSYNFLVDVAELFELYIYNILAKNFSEWEVESPVISLYKNKFYERNIIPDIVMRKDNLVAVFDTKYKNMRYEGRNRYGMGDVDRGDFFQIHTYMSYYQAQKDIELIGGGLIYPLVLPYPEEDQNSDSTHCFSNNVLGGSDSWFCVDGVVIPENIKMDSSKENNSSFHDQVIKNELEFVHRIRSYLEE